MLEVSGVSKSFDVVNGKLCVLKDFNLQVDMREFLCLLGPSGCGKSTLIRIISKLLRPDSGKILLEGSEKFVPGLDVCLVFQNYGLFPWLSLLDNVAFGLKMRGVDTKERHKVAIEYLNLVGLEKYEHYYPHQISGGMQQRVGLARALACNPRALLMDEPFAAVDAQTRERLQEELLRIWRHYQTMVIFVTHSIEEAVFLADRIVVMGKASENIRGEIKVRLPRPRLNETIRKEKDYLDLLVEVRELMGKERS
jgi:NitT/TauT family transport system ATP-binding protein